MSAFFCLLLLISCWLPPLTPSPPPPPSPSGERWSHVCKWSEQHWATLEALATHWGVLEEGLTALTAWLDEKEGQLRGVEGDPSMEEHGGVLEQAAVLQVRGGRG